MELIRGRIVGDVRTVEIVMSDGSGCAPLPVSQAGRKHSPDGFNWGYGGSGPAALAHSILAYVEGNQTADKLYTRYKSEIIAKIDQTSNWEIEVASVKGWVNSFLTEYRGT